MRKLCIVLCTERCWQACCVQRLLPGPPCEIDVESFASWEPLPQQAGPPGSRKRHSDSHRGGRRPWLFTNMIMSFGGGFSIDGVSGPLGNSVDKSLLLALRQHADVLLVGRKTAEAESYNRPENGPRLALVSSSPQRLVGTALFEPLRGSQDRLPIVVTGSNRSSSNGTSTRAGLQSEITPPFVPFRSLTSLGDPAPAILNAGYADSSTSEVSTSKANTAVDLAFALDELGQMGVETVLCEGGPSLSAQLLAHDLVDEINLTVSPIFAKTVVTTPATTPPSTPPMNLVPHAFQLTQLATEDDYLYLRYVRP